MSNARNLANIITGNYDIPSGALDNAIPADGSITAAKLASSLDLTGKTVTLPTGTGGKVLKVQVATSTAITSYTPANSSTWFDIALSGSITVSSSTSKVLVICDWQGWSGNSGWDNNFRIRRNGTTIGVNANRASGNGDGLFGNMRGSDNYEGKNYIVSILDEPNAAGTFTYQLQGIAEGTWYLNSGRQTAAERFGNGVSRMILMEISA